MTDSSSINLKHSTTVVTEGVYRIAAIVPAFNP